MEEDGSSLNELKNALEDTLEARGVLGSIKARIRAEIFQAIEDKNAPKPKLSNENLFINELIREYLAYNNYSQTLSVFLPETGQPLQAAFERSFMSREINAEENPLYPQIPLLYSLLSSRKINGTATGETAAISALRDPMETQAIEHDQPAPFSFTN